MSTPGADLLPQLLTYDDLADRWGLCARQVRRVCKRWRLKSLDLGYRTKRFRPADVLAAEARMAGVGADSRRGWRRGE